ncbi:unnamed protein product [Mytilus edulis]|uniref:Uncharacterized protein n=1 Tax=Mytilus edulis TaxID=6550 RepID=A0A8S3SMP1_MYTED|nr:unnamed protein product [Mytilus edulis]
MSRHPSDNPVKSREQSIAEQYVRFVMSEAVPRAMTLDEVKMASSKDKTIQKAIEFVRTGQWFKIKNITDLEIDIEELQALRSISGELVTYGDTILLRDNRILLFNREPVTKLPQVHKPNITNKQMDENARQNDESEKCKMKKQFDERNHAKPSNIEIGNYVLRKTDRKENKLTPAYEPNPYNVINKKGSMITVTNGEKVVTRNSSKFKKVNRPPIRTATDEIEEQFENICDTIPSNIQDQPPSSGTEQQSTTPQQSERPVRQKHVPKYLEDYVPWVEAPQGMKVLGFLCLLAALVTVFVKLFVVKDKPVLKWVVVGCLVVGAVLILIGVCLFAGKSVDVITENLHFAFAFAIIGAMLAIAAAVLLCLDKSF